jgi:hypothetical protein
MSMWGESRTVIRPRGSTNPEIRWTSSIDSVLSSGGGAPTDTLYTVKNVCVL